MTISDRWIVLKFGGTSVSRRNRWDNIGRIAAGRMAEDGARVLVVVSAGWPSCLPGVQSHWETAASA